MKNAQEQVSAHPDELALQARLDTILAAISKHEARLAEYEQAKGTSESLSKEIALLTQQKKQVQEELNSERKALETHLNEARVTIRKTEEETAEKTKALTLEATRYTDVQKLLAQSQADLEAINIAIETKKEQLKTEVASYEAMQKTCGDNFRAKNNELSELRSIVNEEKIRLNKVRSEYKEAVEHADAQKVSAKESLNLRNEALASLKEIQADLLTATHSLQRTEEELLKRQGAIDEINKKLEKREALLSKNEVLLEEKTVRLRQYKEDLEKHFNKSINVII